MSALTDNIYNYCVYGTSFSLSAINLTPYTHIRLYIMSDIVTSDFSIAVTYSDGGSPATLTKTFTLDYPFTPQYVIIDISSISAKTLTSCGIVITGPGQPCIVTILGINGPLVISGIANSTSTAIYTHPTAITDLTYLPERDQDMRAIQGNTLQAKLTTSGQVKCVGCALEYDEQEGSI